ncbi:purple acid phosphatase 22-like [Mangifera indica]|uniref:purple acid phosphatase 22-like n=1 Tax=Mangifera indica TaxID=29780 RepID=UPI001CFA6B48|nr:purple acid phosphatase 22-like [Mangifera indica]
MSFPSPSLIPIHESLNKKRNMMEKLLSPVLPNLLTICIFPQILTSYALPHGYIRPPAKGLVLSQHKRSESDPQQVHVSLAGKDYIRVSWITEDEKVPSIVEYGEVPGEYNGMATGETTSYNYFFYSSSKIHHVRIGPLQPDTVYYYRCGGFGPEFSFKTPPPTFPIEFAVVGDLGQTEWTNSTLAHVGSKDYDVFLLPGDLSYADTHQTLWDSFGRLVEPFASARPWMVTEGNHEIETFPIIQPHAFKAYNARWRMPYEESGSSSNLYYSFDVAGTHIIMLGSYTDFDGDSAQYKWLESDLSKIDRKKTPWVIALLHAPWYNTNTAHQGEGESMRKSMEKLLYKARVDVVFAGHVHAYERFTRIFNNKADSCGPIYITIGDGGNREELALNFKEPTSPLSLFREPSFGHGRLRILDESHAHWSWHCNNESDSITADEIWFESLSTSKQCSSISLNDEL